MDPPASVLVVDDSDTNRMILRGLLRRDALQVLEAADGEHALDLARTCRPELILLDVMMPGMDGFQVCEALKADIRTREIPVLFLSALSDPADRVRGLELGAVDYIGKPFDGAEVLARVRQQLQLQRLTRRLVEANQRLSEKQALLNADLTAAAAIQRSLTAMDAPQIDGLTMTSRFLPCSQVGGDIFDFARLDDTHVGFYVADVSGHGVPAGMVTVWVSHSMVPHVGHVVTHDRSSGRRVPRSPAEVLTRLDQVFPMDLFGKHFTIAYAVLDLETGRVSCSSAGHPAPLVVRADGRIEEFTAGGSIVGLGGRVPFEQVESVFSAGDRIFMFSDGILEYENGDGEFFGEDRLREILLRSRQRSLGEVCDDVIAGLTAFGGGFPMQDDVTLLAVEFLGRSGRRQVADVPRLALAIDSTLDAIGPAVDALRRFYESTRIGQADAEALELAVSEALANCIWHSYRNEAGHSVEIEAVREPARIVVCVRDRGAPFVPPPPVLPEEDPADRSTLRESGRGTFLMYAVTDEVIYAREGDTNVLTLIKATSSA